SLEYLKQENVRMRFLDYVKKLSKQVDLVDKKGDPDVECFRRAFDKADNNHDGAISLHELEDLIVKVFELEKDNHISKEDHKAEILKHFDRDKNGTINRTEFEQGCTNWLKLKNEANSSGSAFRNIWNQASNAYSVIHKQRSNLTTIQQIMPTILKKVQKKHKIVKEDGEPDINKIQGLFSLIDKDNNGVIQRDDIKQFIETLHFGIRLDPDRVLDELVKEFDADKNDSVDKKEFEDGFGKWIAKAINHDQKINNPTKAIAKFEKDSWGKIDTPVNGVKPQASIVYVIFGVALMITITSAFIRSVKQFSNAAHIPFLFTSFVLAPIALKAKMVIKALLNAQPPVRTNASLTFSEVCSLSQMHHLLFVTVYN
ncbi:EF-hand domain pair containing protein, partial [Tanacetum coccineum]